MLSIRHSFLFIHRQKTGGTSVSEALLPFSDDEKVVRRTQDGVERFAVENRTYGIRTHFTLSRCVELLPPDLAPRLFKFSTLRNPFDRVVSQYFSPNRVVKGLVTGFDREAFRTVILEQQTLREFICLSPDGPLTGDMDVLMRFEQLPQDFREVTRRLGLGDVTLNHRNQGDRRPYREYFDEELRSLAEGRFREELEFGSYEF